MNEDPELAGACAGFTLVEIMIVVAIIGMLAAIAIPSFQRARHESQKAAFLNDIRILQDAFQLYNFDNRGTWPPRLPSQLSSGIRRKNAVQSSLFCTTEGTRDEHYQ